MSLTDSLWTYRAQLVSIYDGDTITVKLDVGFGWSQEEMKIRLIGINAPEVSGPEKPEGLLAKQHAVEWLALATGKWPLIIKTKERAQDKYGGRWDALVFRSVDDECLNYEMLRSGHAVVYK